MGIDIKSIYVTQFPEDKKFWICRNTESNFGIPLFGVETKEGAESLGRRVAGIFGVAFYASKAKDLWIDCLGDPIYPLARLRMMKTLSDECGLYAEDQSEKHRLLFASCDLNEVRGHATELSELFNVPVKVDADVQYCKKHKTINESGGKKKMAKSGKVNKTKLCQELLMQGVSDKEAIDQLTAAHVAEGKSPERAASRAKLFFNFMKGKVKGKPTPVVKKEVKKASVEEPTIDVEEAPVEELAIDAEEVPVEEAALEAEASEEPESTEVEE